MAYAGFLRTLPTPTATLSGFVCLLNAGWFTQADANALDGTTFINGGGSLRIYTDATKTTQLPLEVVTFVTGGTPEVQARVRIPTYTGAATTVWVESDAVAITQPAVGAAFGRNAAWVDFAAVWHMEDTTDSTGNGHTLIPVGSPTVVPSLNGNGYNLNGTNQYLNFNTAPITSAPTAFIVMAKSNSLTVEQVVLSVTQSGTNNNEFKLTFRGDQPGDEIWASVKTTATTFNAESTTPYTTTNYTLAAGRFESSTLMYSSANAGTEGALSFASTAPLNINGGSIGSLRRASGIVPFNGIVDNVKIAKTALSYEYIESEYLNQSNASAFGTSSGWTTGGGGGFQSAWARNSNYMIQ